jgi:type VI secretion system protein ImpH
MATPGRRSDPPVEQRLFEEPYRFKFFQAVRLLERLDRSRSPVGRESRPAREAIRFRVARGLAFPASELTRLQLPPEGSGDPPTLTVAFFGLTGPMGVLPYCYSELVADRSRAGDQTPAAFLDLFNHRLISLFFRAWEKYRPALAFERGEDDPLTRCLFSLMGLGLEPLRSRNEFPDGVLLAFAGAFAQRHRSAVMLGRLLSDRSGMPVEVLQFQGHWLRLDPEDRSSLGASGRNNALGRTLVVGERVWDVRSKFRLRLGPLSIEQFEAMSPDGRAFRSLCQMARLYVDGELDFDVQFVLRADEVPECRLSGGSARGARLGRDAWLRNRPIGRDPDDARFASTA